MITQIWLDFKAVVVAIALIGLLALFCPCSSVNAQETIAAVKGSGTDNTATLTGVAAGAASITASYTEPSPVISGSAAVTITAVSGAGRNKGGLQAGAPWPMQGHDVAHTGRGAGNGATGALKWKYAMGDSVGSSPAIGSDGTVYVGSFDNNLYAIKPDGSLKWKYAIGDAVVSSPAIGSDGTVYVGSWDWNLYAIK